MHDFKFLHAFIIARMGIAESETIYTSRVQKKHWHINNIKHTEMQKETRNERQP
jgi:hypothetical protein